MPTLLVDGGRLYADLTGITLVGLLLRVLILAVIGRIVTLSSKNATGWRATLFELAANPVNILEVFDRKARTEMAEQKAKFSVVLPRFDSPKLESPLVNTVGKRGVMITVAIMVLIHMAVSFITPILTAAIAYRSFVYEGKTAPVKIGELCPASDSTIMPDSVTRDVIQTTVTSFSRASNTSTTPSNIGIPCYGQVCNPVVPESRFRIINTSSEFTHKWTGTLEVDIKPTAKAVEQYEGDLVDNPDTEHGGSSLFYIKGPNGGWAFEQPSYAPVWVPAGVDWANSTHTISDDQARVPAPSTSTLQSAFLPGSRVTQTLVTNLISSTCSATSDGTLDITTIGVQVGALKLCFEKGIRSDNGNWFMSRETLDRSIQTGEILRRYGVRLNGVMYSFLDNTITITNARTLLTKMDRASTTTIRFTILASIPLQGENGNSQINAPLVAGCGLSRTAMQCNFRIDYVLQSSTTTSPFKIPFIRDSGDMILHTTPNKTSPEQTAFVYRSEIPRQHGVTVSPDSNIMASAIAIPQFAKCPSGTVFKYNVLMGDVSYPGILALLLVVALGILTGYIKIRKIHYIKPIVHLIHLADEILYPHSGRCLQSAIYRLADVDVVVSGERKMREQTGMEQYTGDEVRISHVSQQGYYVDVNHLGVVSSGLPPTPGANWGDAGVHSEVREEGWGKV